MNVLIIEDEARTARQLERMLKKYDPAIQVMAQLPSVSEAVAWFSQQGSGQMPLPDLAFMDIHLEDGLAFSIFDQTRLTLPVIFTTAYEEYMIKAFKVNSIDYLLKPVDYDELAAALDKFRIIRQQPGLPDLNALLALIQKPKEPNFKERFMVSLGTKIRSVEVADIAYFFSEEKATFLATKEGMSLPLDYSLDQLSGMVNPAQFFRANRQFLVARTAIQTIHTFSAGKLKLDLVPVARHELFVSLSRVTEFKDWLGR
ncbi:LytR/AlgR family response regulator transcription factor [Spirosoma utsteinense]|uniref:DNA-binding LytR/AlgR family response regulator n=1 Tax=Spirosoma utsteinense TaxID=2585773 RepID=A0ABR6WC69_9BACT|nr:LytTR family DNA-binding domain-containing protein [Spirosoma utsteinense]MBC3787576.1 DNA-binding LytR/AlgR family response regulator [Spirosoma utsteinense]MBC3794108.1 DNA-binding LytR/AlgR family response regulator [Spirosoma utsteinense]